MKKCVKNSLYRELEREIPKAKIMVIATSYFCSLCIGVSLLKDMLYKHQLEKVWQGKLLTVADIVEIAKGKAARKKKQELRDLIYGCIRALSRNEDCAIVFFYNPSPRNNNRLRHFFGREDVVKGGRSLLSLIHKAIREVLHEG